MVISSPQPFPLLGRVCLSVQEPQCLHTQSYLQLLAVKHKQQV